MEWDKVFVIGVFILLNLLFLGCVALGTYWVLKEEKKD